MRPLHLVAISLLTAPAAHAAWPDDISISGLTEHGGNVVADGGALSAAYTQVVRELATAISTTAIAPAHTLGARGFELAFDSNQSVHDVYGSATNPSPWARIDVNEQPASLLATPGFSLRKGLPFSVEIGLAGKWIANTRHATFSGSARVALIEGYKPWPDLNLHVSYTGLVGSDELKLGVTEIGGTLGSKYVLVSGEGLRSVQLSPYVDVSLLMVSATPVVDDQTVLATGAVTYGRRSNNPETQLRSGLLLMPRFSGGIELVTGQFMVRISGGYTLQSLGNFAVAAGFVY